MVTCRVMKLLLLLLIASLARAQPPAAAMVSQVNATAMSANQTEAGVSVDPDDDYFPIMTPCTWRLSEMPYCCDGVVSLIPEDLMQKCIEAHQPKPVYLSVPPGWGYGDGVYGGEYSGYAAPMEAAEPSVVSAVPVQEPPKEEKDMSEDQRDEVEDESMESGERHHSRYGSPVQLDHFLKVRAKMQENENADREVNSGEEIVGGGEGGGDRRRKKRQATSEVKLEIQPTPVDVKYGSSITETSGVNPSSSYSYEGADPAYSMEPLRYDASYSLSQGPCPVYCAFKELGFLKEDLKIDVATVTKNFLEKVKPPLHAVLNEAIKFCNNYVEEYKTNMTKSPMDSSPPCSNYAGIFMTCLYKHIYLHCPAEYDRKDVDCKERRENIKNCDTISPMMTTPSPPYFYSYYNMAPSVAEEESEPETDKSLIPEGGTMTQKDEKTPPIMTMAGIGMGGIGMAGMGMAGMGMAGMGTGTNKPIMMQQSPMSNVHAVRGTGMETNAEVFADGAPASFGDDGLAELERMEKGQAQRGKKKNQSGVRKQGAANTKTKSGVVKPINFAAKTLNGAVKTTKAAVKPANGVVRNKEQKNMLGSKGGKQREAAAKHARNKSEKQGNKNDKSQQNGGKNSGVKTHKDTSKNTATQKQGGANTKPKTQNIGQAKKSDDNKNKQSAGTKTKTQQSGQDTKKKSYGEPIGMTVHTNAKNGNVKPAGQATPAVKKETKTNAAKTGKKQ